LKGREKGKKRTNADQVLPKLGHSKETFEKANQLNASIAVFFTTGIHVTK